MTSRSRRSGSSQPTNPLIAGAFHRMEIWGRGTNRVIEMCEKHGAPPPVFEEKEGFLVVTFRAPLVAAGAAGTSRRESWYHVTVQVPAQVAAFCREPPPAKAIIAELGRAPE